MQNITLVGNLTKDAELKSTIRQGDKNEFVAFTIACNEQKGNEKSTTFYEVTCAKTGVFDYLKKGQKVAVAGPFRYLITKDDSGREYHHLNVIATTVELAGNAPGKKDEHMEEP